jgi:hypothetical protein
MFNISIDNLSIRFIHFSSYSGDVLIILVKLDKPQEVFNGQPKEEENKFFPIAFLNSKFFNNNI